MGTYWPAGQTTAWRYLLRILAGLAASVSLPCDTRVLGSARNPKVISTITHLRFTTAQTLQQVCG